MDRPRRRGHDTNFPADSAHALGWFLDAAPRLIRAGLGRVAAAYGDPWLYVSLAGLFMLERIRPAMPQQRVFSPGLVQDFLWFNLDLAFRVTALVAYLRGLEWAYARLTGGFSLPIFASLPAFGAVAASFVVSDFLQWFHHRVRHRVAAFWYFHEIHHAQRELNPLTDLRVHPVEHLVAWTLIFVPMIVFQLTPYALGVGIAVTMYTKLLHANVRTNLGPLRHVFVSPQFHRIHHSRDPRHHDMNFGVVLTVWDRLFGTLYPRDDEYPDTGLDEMPSAPPARWSPLAWLGRLVGEFWYPFGRLLGGGPRISSPGGR